MRAAPAPGGHLVLGCSRFGERAAKSCSRLVRIQKKEALHRSHPTSHTCMRQSGERQERISKGEEPSGGQL